MEILVNACQAAREVAEGVNTDGGMIESREMLGVGKADNDCSLVLGPHMCEELAQDTAETRSII